mmetsp:Transcript_11089/g.11015  ORF Transcript_11089/g.11015 Transcript_11089/m.11015 type:complete len:134 (-) Transcript_11089:161-562(-)
MCNTLQPEAFEAFHQSCLISRQKKVLKKNNLTLDVLPTFSALFKDTEMLSTNHGRSHLMLNREKQQNEAKLRKRQKEIEEEKDKMIESMREEIEALRFDLKEVDDQQEEAESNRKILRKLYEDKLIDQDGNPM